MNPLTIQVAPAPGLRWRNRRAVEQLTSALNDLGYLDEGPYQIQELPQFQLQLFHHPTESAFAMVLGSAEGLGVELCSATAAGTGDDFASFTATNTSSPNEGILDKSPGVVLRKFPGVSVKELHAEFLPSLGGLASRLSPEGLRSTDLVRLDRIVVRE